METIQTAVLLIEDDIADQHLLRRLLTRTSDRYTIEAVQDLQSAVERLAEKHFDAIITDLTLPDAGDLEAVATLAAIDSDATLIVWSGNSADELNIDVLAAGADDFVQKGDLNFALIDRCIQQNLQRIKSRNAMRRLLAKTKKQNKLIEEQSVSLRANNERLEQLCASAQKFVNNVSHEFRTPLCVVKQHASIISDGLVGEVSEEQIRLLSVIEDRVDGLNNMVDDMLDINRHENGLLAAKRTRVHAAEILPRVISSLQLRASIRKVELVVAIPAELPVLFCDVEKVERTLVNLIINAIKFSPPASKIEIRIIDCTESGEVRFEVCDQGPGIAAEQKKQIFQRFKQATGGMQQEVKGFGLGLNIARELVDLNLGEMFVESQVGHGSTFGFTVPINDPENLIRRYSSRLSQQANALGSRKVSLVEVQIDPTYQPDSVKKANEEIDELINYLIRSEDLMLPGSDGQWTILVSSPKDQVSGFIQRAKKEVALINRNRPQGMLPKILLQNCGQFQLPSDCNRLITCLNDVPTRAIPRHISAATTNEAQNV